METWLRDHLVAAGHMTETGLTRRAKLRPCPGRVDGPNGPQKCQQLVLAGLDDDWGALEARTDPTPLSPLGEALAVIEGRRTFTLRREGGGWVLDGRDHHEITYSPACSRMRRDVVRQHRCGTPELPDPAGQLAAMSTYPETRPPPPPGAAPPF